jgi:hypothetical protein
MDKERQDILFCIFLFYYAIFEYFISIISDFLMRYKSNSINILIGNYLIFIVL